MLTFENGASPEWSLISIDLQTPLTVIWWWHEEGGVMQMMSRFSNIRH